MEYALGLYASPSCRNPHLLSAIAIASAATGDSARAAALLQQALQIAEKIEEPYLNLRADALSIVAEASVKAGDLGLARKAALQGYSDAHKTETFSSILMALAERKSPSLSEKDDE